MDENSKIVIDGGAAKTSTDDSAPTNPNPNSDITTSTNTTTSTNSNSAAVNGGDSVAVDGDGGSDGAGLSRQSSRTPFTNLSQVDADLALARTLQEQERAYMMLSMNGGGGGIGFGRWETGIYIPDDEDDDFGDSHDHEYDDEDEDDDDDEENEEYIDHYDDEGEDAFDVHAHDDSEDNDEPHVELDPSAYPDDEAYARALQDAEEREMAARLLAMAGITEREIVDVEDHRAHRENSQDTWEEVDPDELSYEELIALGDVVGTESRGLSADTIASLPSTNYKCQNNETETDTCVICRLDYEDGDGMTTLPCKHAYHSDCINDWLKINKACPVCSAEVSTSQSS
ncbi:E3 ubiquitin ligase BIG BROTHER-related-like [Chenopodium quinoa]|uniref:E3 ubiquitin ligase BIG BROTHER-related-like n=1 Tax=Chenopodium quinoa TaxID=63459 RepID=UPI000B795F3C|nr:E3 ubiquitin ligase BIG BROTHER-related-like [Chenopodium quinoa]